MLANSPEVEAPRQGNVKTKKKERKKKERNPKKGKARSMGKFKTYLCFWLDVIPYPLSRQGCIL